MKSINLALISSQFQLLNTIELSKKLKIEDTLILLVFYLTQDHKKQITSLSKNHKIRILFFIKNLKYLQYFKLIFIIIFLKFQYKINYLILGHIKNNLIIFTYKLLKFNDLFSVDDGDLLTIINEKPRLKQTNLPLKFFTIFDLNSNDFFKVIKNNYVSQILDEKPLENKTLFIGTTFVDSNLMSKKQYLDILKQIIMKENEIYYFPHPREVSKKYLDIENLNLVSANFGIETYLKEEKFLPNKIISFYSTSLYSLTILLKKNKVDLKYIDDRKHIKSYKRDLEFEYLNNNLLIKEYHTN